LFGCTAQDEIPHDWVPLHRSGRDPVRAQAPVVAASTQPEAEERESMSGMTEGYYTDAEYRCMPGLKTREERAIRPVDLGTALVDGAATAARIPHRSHAERVGPCRYIGIEAARHHPRDGGSSMTCVAHGPAED